MTHAAAFLTPKTIRSPEAISSFLSGEKESAQIVKDANKKCLSEDHLLYNRWEVCKILVQVPFHFIQGYLLNTLAITAKLFCLKDFSKRCSIHAHHKNARFSQALLQKRYGINFLAPLRNLHLRKTAPFYIKPKLSRVLADENPLLIDLKSNATEPDKLEFFHNQGLCNGGIHWLLYLYHLTKNQCENPTAHMRALVRKYKKGFSEQAAFLQNFLWSPQLNIEKNALTINPQKSSKEEVSNLPLGTYGLTMKIPNAAHRLAYLKVQADLGFLIDPYFGVFRFKGRNHGEKVRDFFSHYPWWKIFSDVIKVRFDQVELKI
jgi:hypothetical protein